MHVNFKKYEKFEVKNKKETRGEKSTKTWRENWKKEDEGLAYGIYNKFINS